MTPTLVSPDAGTAKAPPSPGRPALAARLEFMRAVVHELRTPLTPMRAQLHVVRELVKAHPDAAGLQESLNILDRSVTRLSRLVDETLDVSRIQDGQFTILPHAASVARLLTRSAKLFEAQAREAGVELVVDCKPDLEGFVDEDRISQVVENLIANALRHTPRGGTIVILGHAAPRYILVGVNDNGAGVPADLVPNLFQPFATNTRAGLATRRCTGLGLYICKGIVEAHGGQIWCESQGLGRGTSILATLPNP